MSDYLTGFDRTPRTIRSALATSIVLMTCSISAVCGEQLGGREVIETYQTTSCISDIDRNLVTIDSQIECTVTPNDGKDDGQGDSVAAIVARAVLPAASDWGLLVMTLLILTVGSWALGLQRKA